MDTSFVVNALLCSLDSKTLTFYAVNFSLPDDTLRQNFSPFGQIYDVKLFPEKCYGFIK